MTDDFPPGEAPYEATGILPFRFRFFQCEFNYGGWHNFKMADYAATHGFNVIYPYVRTIEEGSHLPKDTKWLTWGGFVNWNKWFAEHDLPPGRYDRLMEMDLVEIHVSEEKFKRNSQPSTLKEAGDCLMIDMEHPVLSPEQLRQQPWYPRASSESGRLAFEKR
jgi:hypothetical protein